MRFLEECGGLAKAMVKKLQRRLCSTNEGVPKDVKEGQFAMYAVDGNGELHRFVAGLGCLSHPEMLRLLELAAEEFGLDREGALLIPCPPGDLQRILGDDQRKSWGCAGGILTRKPCECEILF